MTTTSEAAAERRADTLPDLGPGTADERRIGPLLELSVTDLGLIDHLRLELDAGLNVLTGETGAGKSLLIDALGLALGARADVSLVRHGARSARVEALFDRLPEPLIVIREVTAAGRSTARLDDEAVTAARLADVAGRLVELHGQHDQGRLLDERWQRDLLDAFGGHTDDRAAMAAAVAVWRENRVRLAALSIDPRELARRLDVLVHEAAEIEAADLRPGEADDLRARLAAARQGATIAASGERIHEALAGDDGSIRTVLAAAHREARSLARIDPRFESIAARLAGADAELEDVAADVRGLLGEVDHDARSLAGLEERLSVIYGLERRYGEDEAAVIAYGQRAAEEAAQIRGLEGERDRRAAEDARLLAGVAAAAATLGLRRSIAAARLSAETDAVLRRLGFPPGAFEVAVGRRPAGQDETAIELDGDAVAFDSTGADDVVFRLAPNPGEPARALARIASGGELSRVALAIKQVLAEADDTPTLVFDEVDAGIGGRSAGPIGRSLRELARRHQVLVVTHLPQIAAHADAHLRIAKLERGGRTVTEVQRLRGEARIAELAAMLGGSGDDGPGAAALAQARELVRAASARDAADLGEG
ncbi:MAG: DNA repair protein RecN [Chloroflexota bacterium]